MTECQGCGCRLDSQFLCGDCSRELREVLEELALGRKMYNGDNGGELGIRGPSFLRFLHDARLGFTRLGESERRSNENSRPALARLTNNDNDSFAGSPLELSNEVHQTLRYWAEIVSGTTETLTNAARKTSHEQVK